MKADVSPPRPDFKRRRPGPRRWNPAVLLLLLAGLAAQSGPEVTLLGVEVEGQQLSSANVIRYSSGLQPGSVVQAGDFSRAVKRLWQLGLFSNIQIRLDQETGEGIYVTIVVEENPILGNVHYQGNRKLKDGKFEEKLNLISGQRIEPHLIKSAVSRIKTLYAEEGYLRAEVSGEIIPPRPLDKAARKRLKRAGKIIRVPDEKTEPLTRDLLFTIEENKKVKIAHITFQGNQAFSDARLRRVLKKTKQQRWYLFWRSHYEDEKYNEDKKALETFYRNHGYRDFAVLQDTLTYTPDQRRMNIRFRLYEGPCYHFRNFTWEGNSLFTVEELNRKLNISAGSLYNEEEFNLAVFDRVQGLYMDRGYIYSQIQPQFRPVGSDSLEVHFVITENHQVYVRNVVIKGNTKTRENVIRRELMIFPGDVFNRDKLIRSQRKVWVLNYFANVLPDVVPLDEDEVDLELAVEERSSDRANANIGFTGEYGMTGGGGLEFTNFDMAHPFSSGNGQQLVFQFSVGTRYSLGSSTPASKYRSVSLNFTDPMIFDSPNLVGFSIFYTLRGQSTYYSYPFDIDLRGGSLRWGRRFRWPDPYFRGTWIWSGVQKRYTGTEEDLQSYGLDQARRRTLGINITQILSRDNRDRPEFTTRGSRVSWETTLSGWLLPGNEDYHKHVLNLEWYTPTFFKFVLMSSLKMGVIQPLPGDRDEHSLVPPDEKFLMGGSGIPYGNMLRGYPDNSVGPMSSGRPVGGNALLKYTTEFRFPLSENPVAYVHAFAEMGNVWASHQLDEPFALRRETPLNLKRSAGFGIRFFMPMIGMLGFDMGYGFDDISGNRKPEGWNYHIIFGQMF